jgi:hypothetical protein
MVGIEPILLSGSFPFACILSLAHPTLATCKLERTGFVYVGIAGFVQYDDAPLSADDVCIQPIRPAS